MTDGIYVASIFSESLKWCGVYHVSHKFQRTSFRTFPFGDGSMLATRFQESQTSKEEEKELVEEADEEEADRQRLRRRRRWGRGGGKGSGDAKGGT